MAENRKRTRRRFIFLSAALVATVAGPKLWWTPAKKPTPRQAAVSAGADTAPAWARVLEVPAPPEIDETLELTHTPMRLRAEPVARRVGEKSETPCSPASPEGPVEPTAEVADDRPTDISAEDSHTPASPWPAPRRLLDQLRRLANSQTAPTGAGDWALRALHGLDFDWDSPAVSAHLDGLRRVAEEAKPLADEIDDPALAADVRRARHALIRRIEVWQGVDDWRRSPEETPNVAGLVQAVRRIDNALAASKHAGGWRQYLLLDELAGLNQTSETVPVSLVNRDALVSVALRRLNARTLSANQRAFLEVAPLSQLTSHLWALATPAIEAERLLDDLETYETTGRPSEAVRLAASLNRLAASSRPSRATLARTAQEHYRGINLRVAVTDDLLQRLAPEPAPRDEAVTDTILGMPVRGRSSTETRLEMRLLPGDDPVRVLLEARGVVRSDTWLAEGRATFHNNELADFVARKTLEVRPEGVRATPTEVEVRSRGQLRDVRTDLDGVPLLGAWAQSVARKEYGARRRAARRESEEKIAARVRREMDAATAPILERMNQQLLSQALDYGRRFRLSPRATVGKSESGRMTVRVRLAGEDQLAGHTPRPRALSDSLASVQIHETLANNILERLELHGRTFTPPELYAYVTEKLRLPLPPPEEFSEELSEDFSEEVSVTFAERDPLRVLFRDGQLRIVLATEKVRWDGHCWRDHSFAAMYRPRQSGAGIEFWREAPVDLAGPYVGLRRQLILRGVAARVFPDDRPFPLLVDVLSNDSRLEGLGLTQLVVRDGWLGLSLGPQRDRLEEAHRWRLERIHLRR